MDIETIKQGKELKVLSVAFTDSKAVHFNFSFSPNENILFFLKYAKSTTYFVHNLTFDGLVILEGLLKYVSNFEWLCVKK